MAKKQEKKMKIGFVGQGFVGKAYADYFEKKGYTVVRYSLEPEYIGNKDLLKTCDFVSISVPTPTKKGGFDDSIVRNSVKLVGKGKVALIRSTILPGTTESIQKQNPSVLVMHAPEFLTARQAAEDVAHPKKTVIGIPVENKKYRETAEKILKIMPPSSHKSVVSAMEAEFIKYTQNNFFYVKNIYMSIIYKMAEKFGLNSENILDALLAEPMMGTYHHMHPVRDGGYGAGGECLLKDFEAFIGFYKKNGGEKDALDILESIRDRNLNLLKSNSKDLKIINSIYGA